MTDVYNDNDFNLIHDGMEDELAAINKLPVGSEERLNAMKAMQIRYNLDLNEYELAAKLQESITRQQLEQEKLRFEKEKAEREEADRAAAAKAEARRFKIQTILAGGGLVASIAFAAIGFITDNSENIRNNNRDRDRDRIFNFADKLRR